VLTTTHEALVQALGADRAVADQIVAARRLHDAAAREMLVGSVPDVTDPAFRRYLTSRIGLEREECVLLVYLNASGLFLAEDLCIGHCGRTVSIPARRALRRAFDLDARRLILAHNHPSGLVDPSREDILATREFARLLDLVQIRIEDHCVVSGNRMVSMRALGLL